MLCAKCGIDKECTSYKFYEGKIADRKIFRGGKEWEPFAPEASRPVGDTSFETTYRGLVPVNACVCEKCLKELRAAKKKDEMSPLGCLIIAGFALALGVFWMTPFLVFAGIGVLVALLMFLARKLGDERLVREFVQTKERHLNPDYALLTEKEFAQLQAK